jgi:hypothetical protein
MKRVKESCISCNAGVGINFNGDWELRICQELVCSNTNKSPKIITIGFGSSALYFSILYCYDVVRREYTSLRRTSEITWHVYSCTAIGLRTS